MAEGDVARRRRLALEKVWLAIRAHGGTTLMASGLVGDDARAARVAVQAGVRLLEPNHPAVALARGVYGARDMHEAEAVRHLVPLAEMLRVIRGIRVAAGPDVFITAGVPGAFAEVRPVPRTDADLQRIARAGADGLHTHKCSLTELEEWTRRAHRFGLAVDAYVDHPDHRHLVGVPARRPEEVARVARAMCEMGVDMVGLMTGMTYEGTAAGALAPAARERLLALVETVTDRPTLAEGGINLANFRAFRATGVHVLVVGTAFDDLAMTAIATGVRQFVGQPE